jgi:hypothetical protein
MQWNCSRSRVSILQEQRLRSTLELRSLAFSLYNDTCVQLTNRTADRRPEVNIRLIRMIHSLVYSALWNNAHSLYGARDFLSAFNYTTPTDCQEVEIRLCIYSYSFILYSAQPGMPRKILRQHPTSKIWTREFHYHPVPTPIPPWTDEPTEPSITERHMVLTDITVPIWSTYLSGPPKEGCTRNFFVLDITAACHLHQQGRWSLGTWPDRAVAVKRWPVCFIQLRFKTSSYTSSIHTSQYPLAMLSLDACFCRSCWSEP